MSAEVKAVVGLGFLPKPYLQSSSECMNSVAENELLKTFPLGKNTLRGCLKNVPKRCPMDVPHGPLYNAKGHLYQRP